MKLFFIFISTIVFVSCNSQTTGKTKNNFEKGRLRGNTYSNDFFGFRLAIDTPWHVLNEKELTEIMDERMEMLDQSKEQNLAVSKGIDILLSVTIDTIENMPNVLISSLDISLYPQIKNENDYLDDYFKQVKKMYENYDVQISSSSVGQETINNKTFLTTLITVKSENFLSYQKRYSLKLNNRLLNVMVNYNSDYYLNKAQNLLESIKWE